MKKLIAAVLLCVLCATLSGCSFLHDIPTAETLPTSTPERIIEPTATPTTEPTAEPTATPTAEPTNTTDISEPEGIQFPIAP